MVSVIIPVYNTAWALPKCLDTVLAQGNADLEVLLIDDGSDPETVSVLDDYSGRDRRIRVIRQDHQGAAKARNRGMDEATGEYLYFCDSDDWLSVNLIGKMQAAADAASADIVVAEVRHYDEVLGKVYKSWCPPKNIAYPCKAGDLPGRAFSLFEWSTWNKLFRRRFVEENGLRFQDLPRVNDLYFVNAAVALAKVIVTSGGAYFYRHRTGKNLCGKGDQHPFAAFEAWLALRKLLEQRDLYQRLRGSFARGVMTSVASQVRLMRDFTKFSEVRKRIVGKYLPELGIDREVLEGLDENKFVLDVYDAVVSECADVAVHKVIQAQLNDRLIVSLSREFEFRKKIDAAGKTIEEEKRSRADLEAKLEAALKSAKKSEDRRKLGEIDLADRERRIDEMKGELAVARENLVKERGAVSSSLEVIAGLEASQRNLAELIGSRDVELRKSHERVALVEQECRRMAEEVGGKAAELRQMQERYAVLEGERRQLLDEVCRRGAQLERDGERISRLVADVRRATEANRGVESEVRGLRDEIEALKGRPQNLRQAIYGWFSRRVPF